MKNKIVAFFIVLMLSFSLFAKENIKFDRYRTEPLGFAMGYGTYGVSLNLSICTLRWQHVFWEIFKFHGAYSLEESSSHNDIDPRGYALKAETLFGVPFFLTENNRQEIRVAAGLGLGISRFDETYSTVDAVSEISYIYHFTNYLALQFGVHAAFPLYFKDEMFDKMSCRTIDGDKCYDSIYMPDIQGFVGIRF